jgi:hypothetical protein
VPEIIVSTNKWDSFNVMLFFDMPNDFEYNVADALIQAYQSISSGKKFKKYAVGKIEDGEFKREYRVSETNSIGEIVDNGIKIDFEFNENSLNLYFRNGIGINNLLNDTFKDNFTHYIKQKYQ